MVFRVHTILFTESALWEINICLALPEKWCFLWSNSYICVVLQFYCSTSIVTFDNYLVIFHSTRWKNLRLITLNEQFLYINI